MKRQTGDDAAPGAARRRSVAGRRAGGLALRWATLVLVAVTGGAIGWALAPSATTQVGPLEVQVDAVPSLSPGVHVRLPPAGQVEFDTHLAPVAVQASVTSVDVDQAQQLLASPQGLLALQITAPQVLQDAALRALGGDVACALAGALAAGTLVYRSWRRALQTTALVTVLLVALGSVAWGTFDAAALRQPRFTGLLSRAPYVAGEGREVAERLESYRSGLADFVQSVTTLYAVAGQLPAPPRADGDTTTVLHVSDIHLNPLGFDLTEQLVRQFGADVVVDTGDITTWGTGVESSTLSRIGSLGVPYVFVRGNHDSRATQDAVAAQPGAVVLDGDVAEVAGLTFAGIGDPVFTPAGEGGTDDEADRESVARATEQLADVVSERDQEEGTTGRGVDVALLHDPSRLDPLFGQVPLVLAGHYHRRITRLDESGTRVMVQGSTGGAGLTVRGMERLEAGEPLPLTATLLYFARSGDRAGDLVAYDQVTVGGLGLTSVTVQRTTVPPPESSGQPRGPADAPSAVPSPSSTSS